MGTSRIPHIVIYPAIVHKPRFQLNLLSKSKFFKQALQNQKDLVIIKNLFGAIPLSFFRYCFICLVCTRTRRGRHKKMFFSISIVSQKICFAPSVNSLRIHQLFPGGLK